MLPIRHGLLLAAALLPGVATAAGHELSLGATTLSTGDLSLVPPSRPGLQVAYAHELGAWRLGGGVRWAFSGEGELPFELYIRALLSIRMGFWHPAVGPELGLSGLPIVGRPRYGFPDDFSHTRGERFGPAYVALHATPLRFAFHRFTVSALELQWGTPLDPSGTALRLQLGLLHVGVVL